jgi:hypothetical protein
MGILDKKSRIMDVIVTPEGRRQMHSGDFRAEFVSFSDRNAYYTPAAITGSIADDASQRIYFEASQLPIDQIVFEVDSDGQLLGSDLDPNIKLFGAGGILIRATGSLPTGTATFQKVADTKFISVAEGITSSSIENFAKLKIIGSVNSTNFNMDLPDNKATFDITNFIPFGMLPIKQVVDLNTAEPVVYDSNLNHINQFKFLPPTNQDGTRYGDYTNSGGNGIENFEDLISKIGYLPEDKTGGMKSIGSFKSNFNNKTKQPLKQDVENINPNLYANNNVTQKKSFIFRNTNFSSNFMTQVFEIDDSSKKIDRLMLIDAGEFLDEDDEIRSKKHVYFAGKVFQDSFGVPVFTNIFTLVFD